MPKPVSAVKLSLGSIPAKLKELNRWVLWRYTQLPNGKWTKTPHGANHGHKVDATDFANGTSFTAAVQALRKHKDRFDGLGFLLGDGIAGIDVDDCIDDDGNLNERGATVSTQYGGTYAEVSPSGRGFKILIDISDDAKLAVIGRTTKDMEIYGGNRYFTVTGAKLPGHANSIAPMAQAFAATAAQLGARPAVAAPGLADIPTVRPKESLGIDMVAARELLDHLPFRWCDEYGDWLRAGMALHHEFAGQFDALQLWDEWSQRSPKYDPGACGAKWNTFGKPGKEAVTLRTLVRDAQATGWKAPATVARAVQDFSPLTADPQPTVDDDGILSEPPTWWYAHSAGDLLRTPAPADDWVWKGVLLRGKMMVLAGSGGSSKSYLMLAAAVQYSLGNDWGPFGVPEGATPGRTLLLYGEEDRADVHKRLNVLRNTFMLNDDQVNTVGERLAVLPLRGSSIELAKQSPLTDEIVATEQLQKLEKRILENNIELVVIDPLALFHGLEENDNTAIAGLVRELDALCLRTGCSMILVHHFGKGGALTAREVNESNVRGASSLVAHARTVVVMHRLRRDEAQSWGVAEDDAARWVLWTIAKNNYGPSGRMEWFEVEQATGAIRPSQTQLTYMRSSDLRAQAIAVREEVEAEEISERELRKQQLAALDKSDEKRRIAVLLRYGMGPAGKVPAMREAFIVMREAGLSGSNRSAANVVAYMRVNGLVSKTGSLVTEKGLDWLTEYESKNML